ncbi:MAG: hypothetical protein FWD53_06905 [Phycisphaerales bacterium]|nr:hypothetical protein [Phycisphaerales bacterium]
MALIDGVAIYDSQADWSEFSGLRRITDGVIRCGYRNTAEEIGLTNILFNYRFGQRGDLLNDTGGNRDGSIYTKGTGVAAFTEDGIRSYSDATKTNPPNASNMAVVRLGGTAADYTALESGVVEATVVSFWTKIRNSLPTGTMFGFAFMSWWVDGPYPDGSYYTSPMTKWDFYINASSYYYSGYYYSFNSAVGNWNSNLWTSIQNAMLTEIRDDKFHHVALYIYIAGNRVYGIITVDGRFVGYGEWWDYYYNFKWGTDNAYGNVGLFRPTILGLAQNTAGTESGYGNYDVGNPWPDAIDEFAIARCDLVLDNGTPPSRITEPNELIVGQRLFPAPKRHPDPQDLGTENPAFTYYGPVEDFGVGIVSAFSRVKASLVPLPDLPSAGYAGAIEISTRASPDPFYPDDPEPAWGNWITLEDDTMQTLPAKGTGRYAQVRIRIFPDDTPQCMQSPGIDRLEVYQPENSVVHGGTADLACSLEVGSYVDLPARVTVKQPALADLPARVRIFEVPPPQDLPARLFVLAIEDLPAKLMVKPTINLPARIFVERIVAAVDLPARIVVQHNAFDLPAKIFIKAIADLPAKLTIDPMTIPARIVVHQTGLRDVHARIYLLAEVPSPVQNLMASVPQKTWQTAASIRFSWEPPQIVNTPIARYYYNFSSTPAASASLSWPNTTSRSILLNTSNSGIWYFNVAAQNTEGVLGSPTSCEIWYNNPPGAPGKAFMTISNHDTKLDRPHIAKYPVNGHTLTWSPSFDPDPNDNSNLEYEIQIATRSDFGPNPQNGLPSLAKTYENISDPIFILADSLESGIYFWRIRASDGMASSDWSDIGSFRINVPPSRPTGLTARQR